MNKDVTLKDIEFLARSSHRVGVLDALAKRSCERDDLRTETGASSPTLSRILTDLEEQHWIEQVEGTYQLTDLGAFVAHRFKEFRDDMAYQHRLREVWPWLPHDIDGFSIELFTDVVVSKPGPGYPYQPIGRLEECFRTTNQMRGFGMALLKSGNLEPFFDQVRKGLQCEYIYPPTVFEELLRWDEATVLELASRTNYTVLLHEDLPLDTRCGVCLFDDRVSICCYNQETSTLRSLVDTGSDAMKTWAETYYEQLRKEARPLEEVNELSP